MIYVADTQILIWARTNQRRRLGRHALRALQEAEEQRALIYVSVATLIELDWLEFRGRYQFKESFESVVRSLADSPGYEIAPLTAEIILRSRKYHHLENIDRLIVATAEELDCPLITADLAIQGSRAVPIVWD